MNSDDLDKWRKAGNLASRARDYGKGKIEEGIGKLELVDSVETFIRKNGGTPAFPSNIAVNALSLIHI